MVGLKEFRGFFQPKLFLDSLIHGGGLGMEQHRSPLSGRATMSPWVSVIQSAKLLDWSFLPAEELKQSSWNWLEQVRRQGDGSECAAVGWAVRRARRGLKLLVEEEFNQKWLICADILLQTPWV